MRGGEHHRLVLVEVVDAGAVLVDGEGSGDQAALGDHGAVRWLAVPLHGDSGSAPVLKHLGEQCQRLGEAGADHDPVGGGGDSTNSG